MSPDDEITYATSGVDFDREAVAIKALVKAVSGTRTGLGGQPLDLPGHFAGGVRWGELALILCTDGVGTKMLVAEAMGVWDTIGIDCIAMNANDAICVGAEPVAFVDYLATHHADPDIMASIGRGLAEGARQANVAIVGGETATLPEMVHGYDLAGACLAICKEADLIRGDRVAPGDVLIGLPSSGVHSNGLTMARRCAEKSGLTFHDTAPELGGATIGATLLTPTKMYVKAAMKAIKGLDVHGLGNVTGGGVLNISRINPAHRYVLDGVPEPLPVFRMIKRLAKTSDREMYKTFNMGTGFVIVVDADERDAALELLKDDGAFVLGHVEKGIGGVTLPSLGLEYVGAKGH